MGWFGVWLWTENRPLLHCSTTWVGCWKSSKEDTLSTGKTFKGYTCLSIFTLCHHRRPLHSKGRYSTLRSIVLLLNLQKLSAWLSNTMAIWRQRLETKVAWHKSIHGFKGSDEDVTICQKPIRKWQRMNGRLMLGLLGMAHSMNTLIAYVNVPQRMV